MGTWVAGLVPLRKDNIGRGGAKLLIGYLGGQDGLQGEGVCAPIH